MVWDEQYDCKPWKISINHSPNMIITISSNKNGQSNNPAEINIDGEKINSESSVLLLGLEIDSKLNFD